MENKMRIILLSGIFCFAFAVSAKAQFTAQKEAQYMATLKAVTDYKINDEENLKKVEQLRQDARFNLKLSRMLEKLQNTKTKDSKNQRIYKILLNAGEEIYKELD